VRRQPTVDHKAALAALPSLGAKSAEMLVEAGIADVKTLRRLGPLKAYRRLRFHFGRRVSTNFAYAIECALRGIDWRLLEAARKLELKAETQRINADLEAAARR
jgi:hypothetical protein